MQQESGAAAIVEIAPAAVVKDVAPVILTSVSLQDVVYRVLGRLVEVAAVRIRPILIGRLLPTNALRQDFGGDIRLQEARHPCERLFRHADQIFVPHEQGFPCLALLERPRDVIRPAALGRIEMPNTLVDFAQRGEPVAAEQESHVEERQGGISSVPDEVDHRAALHGHLMGFDDLHMVQRVGQGGARGIHDVAGIGARLRLPLESGKVLPCESASGTRVGHEVRALPAGPQFSPIEKPFDRLARTGFEGRIWFGHVSLRSRAALRSHKRRTRELWLKPPRCRNRGPWQMPARSPQSAGTRQGSHGTTRSGRAGRRDLPAPAHSVSTASCRHSTIVDNPAPRPLSARSTP